MAEGASALVLESEESVRQRQATCYGEILGGHCNSELAGLYAVDEEGEALASLLSHTLAQRDVKPHELGFVVAHGQRQY